MPEPQDRPTTVVMVVDDGSEVQVGSLSFGTPDVVLVDLLARWRLLAGRRGWRMLLRDAPADLVDLLDLVGLADLVGADRRASLPPAPPRSGPARGAARDALRRSTERRD